VCAYLCVCVHVRVRTKDVGGWKGGGSGQGVEVSVGDARQCPGPNYDHAGPHLLFSFHGDGAAHTK